MQVEKFPDNWLFKGHSKEEIKSWVKQLRFFYFVRAWGGHNNDGDRFVASFGYCSIEDLITKLDSLGVIINTLPDSTPRPVPGVSYPSEEFWKFKVSVTRFPELEQPGSTTINSTPCHIYINDTTFQISVSGSSDGNAYEVTSNDFEICKQLERFFLEKNFAGEKDFEIETNAGCVSRNKYPELY